MLLARGSSSARASASACRSRATANAARTATSVLPKPTSPQTSRSIGRGASRSSFTASIARSWSSVSRYGNSASSRSSQSLLEVVRDARRLLALRVEREQLAGELAHRLARAVLEVLPRLAAELRQRRRLRVGADVARDLADLLVRDVQAVLAAEGEQEVVARDAGDRLRLEAEQLPDAVVLVDDVVARAQVGERLERAADARGVRRGARLRKTCVSGRRTRPSSRQTKPRRAGETAKRTCGSSGSTSPGSSSARRRGAAGSRVRSASPRCGNATTTRWPARTKRVSSFSASASPRAASAGRCASNANGWPGRQRVELAHVRRRSIGSRPSSSQTWRTSSGSQTRSGPAGSSGDEVVGRPDGASSSSQRRLDEVEAPLGGRVDDRLVDGVQRALRERRERADLLDLVAEELDPQRLAAGRREDVDEPAAHGELAALLDALDALVARRARAPR